MKRRITVIQALLLLYESGRALFILTSRPEFYIQFLPYSWYASVPLLVLPILLAPMAKQNSSERFLYAMTKLGQLFGSIVYIIQDFPLARNGALNDWYSLKLLFSVVLFSVIDAILFVILIIPHRGTVEDADNSSSQR